MSNDNSDAQRDARRKSDAATANENALRALPQEFPGILFPDSMRERSVWRVTRRERGKVAGFEHLGVLAILATNGIIAWYVRCDGTAWLGHVGHFDGEVVTLHSSGKLKATSVREVKTPRLTRSTGRAAVLATL